MEARHLLVAAMTAALVLAGCGSGSKAHKASTVSIAYRGIAIAPADVTVHVGDTIAWRNDDPTPHNVTSSRGPQQFASKDFGKNGAFTITAKKAGVIDYLCTIHPASMVGRITVVR